MEIPEHDPDRMDELVAIAIGRDAYEAQLNGFMPSTRWEDAMHAAQETGLLDRGLFVQHCGPQFSIENNQAIEFYLAMIEGDWRKCYIASTPQMAVCIAILNFSRNKK